MFTLAFLESHRLQSNDSQCNGATLKMTPNKVCIPIELLEAADAPHGEKSRWAATADAGKARFVFTCDPEHPMGRDNLAKWLNVIVARCGPAAYPLRVQLRSDSGPLLAEAMIWGDEEEELDDDDGTFLPSMVASYEPQYLDAPAISASERLLAMVIEQPEVMKGACRAIADAIVAARNSADAAVIEAAVERGAERTREVAARAAEQAVIRTLVRFGMAAGYEVDDFGEIVDAEDVPDGPDRPGVEAPVNGVVEPAEVS